MTQTGSSDHIGLLILSGADATQSGLVNDQAAESAPDLGMTPMIQLQQGSQLIQTPRKVDHEIVIVNESPADETVTKSKMPIIESQRSKSMQAAQNAFITLKMADKRVQLAAGIASDPNTPLRDYGNFALIKASKCHAPRLRLLKGARKLARF
jgi:hypothetical protein